MHYDWKPYAPAVKAGPAEHAAFLDRRVAEMSPKEWRLFRAAMEMAPQNDLAGLIALTQNLPRFEYYYPAADAAEAGRLLALREYGADDVIQFLDYEKVYTDHVKEHGGVLVDGAFVQRCSDGSIERIAADAAAIREFGIPPDDGWSAKLKLRGPTGEEAWLRLPDYEESNFGAKDEIASTLDAVGAGTLDECTLTEAKCILPGIDLMHYDKPLATLVYEASNLGYALHEEPHGNIQYFEDVLRHALEYENCGRLDFALDIVANLDCFDFVPDAEWRAEIDDLISEGTSKIITNALDYEAYAADNYRDMMWRVDGGFFRRNDRPFHFDYSISPEQQAALSISEDLAQRFDEKLDKCQREYVAEMAVQDPECLVRHARDIVATEDAYEAFRHGAGLNNALIEQLLTLEDPLEILRNAWEQGMEHESATATGNRVQTLLDDPRFGEIHDPGQEPRNHPTEPELRME